MHKIPGSDSARGGFHTREKGPDCTSEGQPALLAHTVHKNKFQWTTEQSKTVEECFYNPGVSEVFLKHSAKARLTDSVKEK